MEKQLIDFRSMSTLITAAQTYWPFAS